MAQVTILVGGKPTKVNEVRPGLFGELGYKYSGAPSAPMEGETRVNPTTGKTEFYNPEGEWQEVTMPGQAYGTEGQIPAPTAPTAPKDTTAPKSSKEVDDFLTDLSTSVDKDERESVSLTKDFKSWLEGIQPPKAPDSVSQYKELRQVEGLDVLENDYNQAVSDLRSLENEIVSEQEKIKGQPGVSSRYINRRLVKLSADRSEALRQQEQKVRDIATRVDTKNKTVSLLMGFTKTDYQNAVNQYQFQFNKAISIYSIFSQEQNRQVNNARASLKIVQDAIKSGNLDPSQFTDYQRQMIQDLEVKAGEPIGTTEFLTANVKEKIFWKGMQTDEKGQQFLSVIPEIADGKPDLANTYRVYTGGKKLRKGQNLFYDESGNEISAFDAARLIVKANPTASENDLVNAIRENVVDNDGKPLIDVGDAQRIARESITKRPPLTIEEIKQEIINTLTPLKDTYSKKEAKIAAEIQLKSSLGLEKKQSLPAIYQKAIDDAVKQVYSRIRPEGAGFKSGLLYRGYKKLFGK